MKPLNKKVILEKINQQKKTVSGLILQTPHYVDIVNKGKVVGKGDLDIIGIKEGDIALYSIRDLEEVELDGKVYEVVDQKNILAVL